jgi:hypothetical protein
VSAINFKNAKEAEVLLAERVERLWSKLMIGRLLDDKGVPLGDGELPTVVAQKDGTVIMCANVQIYFHLEAYYTKFVPEMKALLEALAVGRGEAMVNRATWQGEGPAPQSRFGGVAVYGYGAEPFRRILSDSPHRETLWISDGRDDSGLSEHFSGYELPIDTTGPIRTAVKKLRGVGYRLELFDGAGSVVSSVTYGRGSAVMRAAEGRESEMANGLRVPLENVYLERMRHALWNEYFGDSPAGVYVLSPSFRFDDRVGDSDWRARQPLDPYVGHGLYCDVFETRLELVLPAADLANVKGYRITAVE